MEGQHTELHQFQFTAPRPFQFQAIVLGPLQFRIPELFAVAGTATDDGQPAVLVLFEWPSIYQAPPPGTPEQRQLARETHHLWRFRRDLRELTGADPYEGDAQPGGDPPDLVCQRDGETIGVELTQLVTGDRVAGQSIFRRIRERVLAAAPARFRALRGRLVYVGFDDPLPFNRDQDIATLIEALASYTPPPPIAGVMGDTVPLDQHPTSIKGATISSAQLDGKPGDLFYSQMCWELVVAQTSMFSDLDAWAQLEKRVSDHDQNGVDDVIIPVCAPVVEGYAYPSDRLVADAVVRQADSRALVTDHIRRVLLHVWPARLVVELIPGTIGYRTLCGDLENIAGVVLSEATSGIWRARPA